MKRCQLLSVLAAALMCSPVVAQEYWEYEPLEGEVERHQPIAGVETEYENSGDIELESEAYEYEAGEGYHEEEWYDPSDWFDDDNTVDYEYDLYGDSYDYGYTPYRYDYYDYDYDYAYNYDDVTVDDVDYEFDQQVTGRIEGLQRYRGDGDAPRSVRMKLKTDDGKTRILHLGDLAYVSRYLPKFKNGSEVVIGGEMIEKDGQRLFQAKEMRTEDESYLIPDYEYNRRLDGQLKGLRKVRMKDGDVELVVARVQTQDGKMMDVRLGDPDELQGISRTMRPGAKVRVEGYKREVDGKSTLVVQDFKLLKRSQDGSSGGETRQARKGGNGSSSG